MTMDTWDSSSSDPRKKRSSGGLPSEPLESSPADTLDAAPALDPLTLGLDTPSSVSSIVFPVAPPAPEAESTENADPED
ncbi:hypothetical protein AB1285_13645 [Microbacterium sp. NRRL B-14842]|uniref:hypothetical protein n=1 Tax=Microbacterium sp. NRRL B-14842 TaxID=3162881 RepID=UPI003D2B0EC0